MGNVSEHLTALKERRKQLFAQLTLASVVTAAGVEDNPRRFADALQRVLTIADEIKMEAIQLSLAGEAALIAAGFSVFGHELVQNQVDSLRCGGLRVPDPNGGAARTIPELEHLDEEQLQQARDLYRVALDLAVTAANKGERFPWRDWLGADDALAEVPPEVTAAVEILIEKGFTSEQPQAKAGFIPSP